ncbi:hypothetical protein KILIM_015_00010, partial [Kineosphaera limosa NBRC 100340]
MSDLPMLLSGAARTLATLRHRTAAAPSLEAVSAGAPRGSATHWQVFGLAGTSIELPIGLLLAVASQVVVPVRNTAVVPTHRCGGSPGFTPDSLLRLPPEGGRTSIATLSRC